jgi:alpha-galactosidase
MHRILAKPLTAGFVLGVGLMAGANAGPAAQIDPEVNLNRKWAEGLFPSTPANRLIILHEDELGDTKVGRCVAGGPLRLGEKVHQRGLGVNSQSTLRVMLDRPARKLTAVIGLDRNVDNTKASCRFRIRAGSEEVFATEVLRANAVPRPIEVLLDGVKEFDLIVDDAGDGRGWDQGDWADARVILQDGSELWLDGLPIDGPLPFSFLCGGKPSSGFLRHWSREVQVEKTSDTTSRRTLTLTDSVTKLEVRAVCLVYQDTEGVDWTVHLTNKGDKDSPIIEEVKVLDAAVPVGTADRIVVHRLNGAPCQADDWMPFEQPIVKGQRVEFAATNGRSSNVSPWFTADWGDGGVITAIGWSGQWSASLHFNSDRLHARIGMERLHTVLHPGESLRSPRILQLRWQGGDVSRAYNLFRRTMFSHILPRTNGQLVWPPIAHLSTAFYEMNDSNEQNVLAHLESLRGLGFEMFWLDAYWTGPSGFPNSMGNYGFPIERVEPKDRFPRGLRAVADAVEKEGLRFLMWFEPERVVAGTFIAKEHPEWVISPAGDGGGLYNLGIPEARRYMTDYLNAAIQAYKLSCLRIDYNIDPLAFWRLMDARDTNRVGLTEMRYVEGLYRMWDDVLKANPGLFIDNCASGGRRIDLETMSRSLPLWRSDNTCDMTDLKTASVLAAARKNQLMSIGLNRYVPFSTVGQMGATPYLIRSGFNAGLAFAEDVRLQNYPRELLRQGVAEGKRLRKYFLGDFYPLVEAGADPRGWVVMQYHRPTESDGMIMAFRRDQSDYLACEGRLREIDPAKDYEVTFYRTYEPEKPVTLSGSALRRLRMEISECPGSLLVEYHQAAGPGQRSP